MEATFSRSVTDVGDAHVVTLSGELDAATSDGLLEWFTEIAGSTVVVDLSDLTYMDSSGIGVMVQAKRRLGDSFVLTRPQPPVERVFEITGLMSLFSSWDPAWSD